MSSAYPGSFTPGHRVRDGEQLVLATLIGGVGNHVGAWRRPGSRIVERREGAGASPYSATLAIRQYSIAVAPD